MIEKRYSTSKKSQ